MDGVVSQVPFQPIVQTKIDSFIANRCEKLASDKLAIPPPGRELTEATAIPTFDQLTHASEQVTQTVCVCDSDSR